MEVVESGLASGEEVGWQRELGVERGRLPGRIALGCEGLIHACVSVTSFAGCSCPRAPSTTRCTFDLTYIGT